MKDQEVVVDQNGIEIFTGQTVSVHQYEGNSIATVIETFPDSPTVKQPGHWVDINRGDGVEEMMSYILEVVNRGENS